MLEGCNALNKIITPNITGNIVLELPQVEGTYWRLPDGTKVSSLGKGTVSGILLNRSGADGEAPGEGNNTQNGLGVAEDGKWYYYFNGEIDRNYTGLYCDAVFGWWLVREGEVAFDYTGLWCDANYGWWLVNGGTVAFDYTGLWEDPLYGEWYILNGTVDFTYTHAA